MAILAYHIRNIDVNIRQYLTDIVCHIASRISQNPIRYMQCLLVEAEIQILGYILYNTNEQNKHISQCVMDKQVDFHNY